MKELLKPTPWIGILSGSINVFTVCLLLKFNAHPIGACIAGFIVGLFVFGLCYIIMEVLK